MVVVVVSLSAALLCHLVISSSDFTFSSFGPVDSHFFAYLAIFFPLRRFLGYSFNPRPISLVRALLSSVLFEFQTDLLRFLVTSLQAFGTACLDSAESSWKSLVNPHDPLSDSFLLGILLALWSIFSSRGHG